MIKISVLSTFDGHWNWQAKDGDKIVAVGGLLETDKSACIDSVCSFVDGMRAPGYWSVPVQDEDFRTNDNDIEMISIGKS